MKFSKCIVSHICCFVMNFINVLTSQTKYRLNTLKTCECLLLLFSMIDNMLSQSYNAIVFYFDNISFWEHVLNQLYLPNECSVSQASYRIMVKQSVSNCSRNKPFYGGRVVEKKNEMKGYQYPTCDMRFVQRKRYVDSEISFGILYIFKR